MSSTKRIDFKELRERIPIERACDFLGVKLKEIGAQFRGSCPICNHTSDRCLVVTPALNRYWCFGKCRSGGDVIELVVRAKQLSHIDAATLLIKHFGGS